MGKGVEIDLNYNFTNWLVTNTGEPLDCMDVAIYAGYGEPLHAILDVDCRNDYKLVGKLLPRLGLPQIPQPFDLTLWGNMPGESFVGVCTVGEYVGLMVQRAHVGATAASTNQVVDVSLDVRSPLDPSTAMRIEGTMLPEPAPNQN